MLNSHDRHNYRILSQIDSGRSISQRSIAAELGIALGLANLLIKRLAKKGYIKTSNALRGNRLKYVLTPKGLAEKSRLTTAYLERTLNLYTETRDKIRASLGKLATLNGETDDHIRIVFYGAGDVAEIAYIALDHSHFDLVGVLDDDKAGQDFLSHPVFLPREYLAKDDDEHSGFDYLVVTTFKKAEKIRQRLDNLKVPDEKVLFL